MKFLATPSIFADTSRIAYEIPVLSFPKPIKLIDQFKINDPSRNQTSDFHVMHQMN